MLNLVHRFRFNSWTRILFPSRLRAIQFVQSTPKQGRSNTASDHRQWIPAKAVLQLWIPAVVGACTIHLPPRLPVASPPPKWRAGAGFENFPSVYQTNEKTCPAYPRSRKSRTWFPCLGFTFAVSIRDACPRCGKCRNCCTCPKWRFTLPATVRALHHVEPVTSNDNPVRVFNWPAMARADVACWRDWSSQPAFTIAGF